MHVPFHLYSQLAKPIRISPTDETVTNSDFIQTRQIACRLQCTPQVLELGHQRRRIGNIRSLCVHFTLHSNKCTATTAVCAMLSHS